MIIDIAFQVFQWGLIIYILTSYFNLQQHVKLIKLKVALGKIYEPMLIPLRKFLVTKVPKLKNSAFDFSPIVLLVIALLLKKIFYFFL